MTLLSRANNLKLNAVTSDATVIDANLDIQAGVDNTLAALNFLASIEPLVLVDEQTPPASGNIKLRSVHAAPSAGAVDIYVTGATDEITTQEPTIEDFDFKQDSGYMEVPAGTYRVRITIVSTKAVAIDSGALVITEGQIRTAFAFDPSPGSSNFGALLWSDLN